MILIDTHVLIWAMQDEPRLGAEARIILERAAHEGGIGISAITVWEIAMLAQKGRLTFGREVGAWIEATLAQPGLSLIPIEPAMALDSVRLPGDFHADPADRLIIATARHEGWPLMTADVAILNYGAEGHLAVLDARH